MGTSKVDRFKESTDPRLEQLREQLSRTPPYQPKPGDPDYQSPEQVERIKRERENW